MSVCYKCKLLTAGFHGEMTYMYVHVHCTQVLYVHVPQHFCDSQNLPHVCVECVPVKQCTVFTR